VARLRRHNALLLAEKIETPEQFAFYRQYQFDLFQGFYFQRPTVVKGGTFGENRLALLRLLANLNAPTSDAARLEQLIVQDAGLSYKILRYINSPGLGVGRTIRSIRQAVVYFGIRRIRAWAMLASLLDLQDKPHEILNNALTRASMLQCMAQHLGEDAECGYTVGLLSLLDVMLERDMASILAELPLEEDADAALRHRGGVIGALLKCIQAYERGDWEQVLYPGIRHRDLVVCYIEAADQAHQFFATLSE